MPPIRSRRPLTPTPSPASRSSPAFLNRRGGHAPSSWRLSSDDFAQHLEVARGEHVAIVVLLGEGAAGLAELRADLGIGPQPAQRQPPYCCSVLGLDQQRAVLLLEDLARLARRTAPTIGRRSAARSSQCFHGTQRLKQRDIAQRHQTHVGRGVQAGHARPSTHSGASARCAGRAGRARRTGARGRRRRRPTSTSRRAARLLHRGLPRVHATGRGCRRRQRRAGRRVRS